MSIFFVDEICINHNGNINTSKELIAAKSFGCISINLRKRTIDKVSTKDFYDSSEKSTIGKTQRDHKEGLKFNFE